MHPGQWAGRCHYPQGAEIVEVSSDGAAPGQQRRVRRAGEDVPLKRYHYGVCASAGAGVLGRAFRIALF